MAGWSRPRPIESADDVGSFCCGVDPLDSWFADYAFTNHQAGMAKTYVCAEGARVNAFYSLATAAISHSEASPRVTRGVGRYEIAAIVLARLAVDGSQQGTGLGRAMLRDALIRVLDASAIVGVRCLLIHAKDEAARAFYMHQAEFEPSPTDPFHLMLLMKDLRKTVGSS